MKRRASRQVGAAHPEQPALLEQMSADSSPGGRQRVLYRLLTNRNNLLNILSSGWIPPAACYQNYYADAGQFSRDGIVLLRNDPPEDLCLRMVGNDPAVFPVVLYVDVSGLDGEVATIDLEYRVRLSGLTTADTALAMVCKGMLPSSRVVSIHFRSDTELLEHRVREYSNIRSDAIKMVVSGEVFQGPAVDFDRLTRALEEANGLLGAADQLLIRRAGAVGGAVVMLASAIHAMRNLPMSLVSVPLDGPGYLDAFVAETPTDDAYGGEAALRQCAGSLHLLLSGETVQRQPSDVVAEIIARCFRGEQRASVREQVARLALFVLACETLSGTTPDDYYSQAALDAIREKLSLALSGSTAPGSGEDLADDVSITYLALLDEMQQVLDGVMDSSDFPVDADPAVTGLLRFLQRSSPAAALSWIQEIPRPADDAIAIAMVLAGILHGRERIPVDIRPEESFMRYVDERLCWRVNSTVGGLLPRDSIIEPEIETSEADGRPASIVKWNGEIIMSRPIETSPAAFIPDDGGHTDAGTEQAAPDRVFEADRQGTVGDQAEQVKAVLGAADLKQSPAREACIQLCRLAGWGDCLTTVFLLDRPDVFLRATPDNQKVELRIPGVIKPFALELREREFRSRLGSATAASVPLEVWNEVASLLRGAAGPEVRQQRGGGRQVTGQESRSRREQRKSGSDT